ncbi:hypothetical protein FRC11_003612, partial [Ceratobasidium sp. 423]
AHSEDFCNEFNLCPGSDDSLTSEGTCDEDAIFIPDIQPSQFRYLMRIIYCLPSNSLALTRTAPNDKKAIVGNFDCYLDIAILSRRFGMEKLEQWAKQELSNLVHESGKDLADGFDESFHEIHSEKQDDLETLWGEGDIPPAAACNRFRFIEAIRYAKATSDRSLLHGLLGAMQCCCARTTNVKFLISFLAITDLREVAPSLYGFLFLLLLRCGNSVWMGDEFTQEDRMAFFSAQSFLTPLPQSLKQSLVTPLFKKISSDGFARILFDDASKGDHDGCSWEVSSRWGRVFLVRYYKEINSEQFSVLTDALVSLPSRRFDLANQLRLIKCRTCRRKILELLDRDIKKVFTRLVGYYKPHD